jgi:N6-L-threonylcarbamoyladenine synthase
MAARQKQAGDLHPVLQWPGHKNAHISEAFYLRLLGVKQRPMTGKPLTILGIETSCDETAAAVVRGQIPGPGEILSNIIFSQTEAHAPYGGVVPEIASRAHLEILDDIIQRALDQAQVGIGDLDGIAATAGPGLIGGVMVGLTTAKALALGAGKPLIAVNHLMGHALTARLTHGVAFPYLLLLVSGGHCQLLGVGGAEDFRLYGTTIDDAVGEAFDKTAKILGLPYPGGPAVEQAARGGNPRAYDLPRPLLNRRDDSRADFSFSGLKTALRQLAQAKISVADASASFQAAVIDILSDRSRLAMRLFRRDFPGAGTFVVAGGVAANQAIGTALAKLCKEEGFVTRIPPPRLCTDNAAMIAWAGVERLTDEGGGSALSVSPKARWPLATFS